VIIQYNHTPMSLATFTEWQLFNCLRITKQNWIKFT